MLIISSEHCRLVVVGSLAFVVVVALVEDNFEVGCHMEDSVYMLARNSAFGSFEQR